MELLAVEQKPSEPLFSFTYVAKDGSAESSFTNAGEIVSFLNRNATIASGGPVAFANKDQLIVVGERVDGEGHRRVVWSVVRDGTVFIVNGKGEIVRTMDRDTFHKEWRPVQCITATAGEIRK